MLKTHIASNAGSSWKHHSKGSSNYIKMYALGSQITSFTNSTFKNSSRRQGENMKAYQEHKTSGRHFKSLVKAMNSFVKMLTPSDNGAAREYLGGSAAGGSIAYVALQRLYGGGWRGMTGQESLHIPPGTCSDPVNVRCQGHLAGVHYRCPKFFSFLPFFLPSFLPSLSQMPRNRRGIKSNLKEIFLYLVLRRGAHTISVYVC